MSIEDYLDHESCPTATSRDADLLSRMSAPTRGNREERRRKYRRYEDHELIVTLRKLADEEGKTIRGMLDRVIEAAERRAG